VRGINTGRGTGLNRYGLDDFTPHREFWLLEQAGMLDAAVGDGVRKWYADFLKWMTTNTKGLRREDVRQ